MEGRISRTVVHPIGMNLRKEQSLRFKPRTPRQDHVGVPSAWALVFACRSLLLLFPGCHSAYASPKQRPFCFRRWRCSASLRLNVSQQPPTLPYITDVSLRTSSGTPFERASSLGKPQHVHKATSDGLVWVAMCRLRSTMRRRLWT